VQYLSRCKNRENAEKIPDTVFDGFFTEQNAKRDYLRPVRQIYAIAGKKKQLRGELLFQSV